MDLTPLLTVALSAATSGVISIIVFLFSQSYITGRYRRKIIRTIFRRINISTTSKSSSLREVIGLVSVFKIVWKLLFFWTFVLIAYLIYIHFGSINSLGLFSGLELLYTLTYILLFIIIAMYSILRKKHVSEVSYWRYTLRGSLYLQNSDFIMGWLFFILFAFYLTVLGLRSFIADVTLLILTTLYVSTFFLLFPILKYFYKYEESTRNLETLLFQDRSNDVVLKVSTMSTTIEGKITGIGDELTVTEEHPNTKNTVFVPWEHIQEFEIVEPQTIKQY